ASAPSTPTRPVSTPSAVWSRACRRRTARRRPDRHPPDWSRATIDPSRSGGRPMHGPGYAAWAGMIGARFALSRGALSVRRVVHELDADTVVVFHERGVVALREVR